MSSKFPDGFDELMWPQLEGKQKGLEVPHMGRFGTASQECLRERGYIPVDVRFLTGARGVTLTLLGARMGTITLNQNSLKALELEARIAGLVGNKIPQKPKDGRMLKEQSAVDMLIAIGSDKTMVDLRGGIKDPAGGRPLGKKDAKARKQRGQDKRKTS